MGQVGCKRCSIGTYVTEKLHPGKSATDCQACPYGEDIDVKCIRSLDMSKL